MLFFYRNTLEALVAQRQAEAEAMAYVIAGQLEGRALPAEDELARLRGIARCVALLEVDRSVLIASGACQEPTPQPDGKVPWWEALFTAPRGGVSGAAELPLPDRRLVVHVEMPAETLTRAVHGVRVLSPVVLVLEAVLVLVLVFYLYRHYRPFERLLRRARETGSLQDEDEISFLLRTLEEAVDRLSAPGRRQTEERQLAHVLARIGELSAGVAHEMRNSLATLQGYLTLIERGPGQEDVEEYVGELRRETDHLKRVVDDFLIFARPGSTRMERLDLERLLRRAAADPALAGMAVRFVGREDGSSALWVRGDAQLLERAFRNLLHNAAEAERGAGRNGPVEVQIEAEAKRLVVAVRDRGKGLPDEVRERLFHPFTSHRPGGVGLGLALAHRILELHHGSIRLVDREGGGVEARVSLPGPGEPARPDP